MFTAHPLTAACSFSCTGLWLHWFLFQVCLLNSLIVSRCAEQSQWWTSYWESGFVQQRVCHGWSRVMWRHPGNLATMFVTTHEIERPTFEQSSHYFKLFITSIAGMTSDCCLIKIMNCSHSLRLWPTTTGLLVTLRNQQSCAVTFKNIYCHSIV